MEKDDIELLFDEPKIEKFIIVTYNSMKAYSKISVHINEAHSPTVRVGRTVDETRI